MPVMNRVPKLLCVVMLFAAAVALSGCYKLIDRMIEKKLTSTDYEILEDPGIHVIMAGTGSPRLDPKRGPACVAVIAGGEFMLFDAGEACIRRLEMMDLPIDRIGTIFITHLHSDHFGNCPGYIVLGIPAYFTHIDVVLHDHVQVSGNRIFL